MTQKRIYCFLLGLLLFAPKVQAQDTAPLYIKPLVNLKAVSSSLTHRGISLLMSERNAPLAPLTSPVISVYSELEVKLNSPEGFRKENGLIYFGTSIKVTNPKTGKVFADLKDVYKADAQGYKPEHLKSLKANITLNRGSYGEEGDQIAIEVVFFDKKSSGKVSVVISPLTLTSSGGANTQMYSDLRAPGYMVSSNMAKAAADAEPILEMARIYAESPSGLAPPSSLSLTQGQSWVMSISTQFPFEGDLASKVQWHHWDGELIAEEQKAEKASKNMANKAWNLQTPATQTPLQGLYLLTGTLTDEQGRGVSMQAWVVCGELSSQMAKQQVAGQLMELAKFYRKSGVKELAHSLLSNALEVYSASAENLYSQGQFYLKDGNTDEAITYFEQALLVDSLYFDARLALGMAYKSQREYGDALEQLRICTELKPTHYEALYQTGWLQNQRGRYEEALKVLQQASRYNNSMDAQVYHERGFANLKLENYKTAALDFEKFTTLAPNDFRGFFDKGIAYLKLKDYERAAASLGRAVKLDSQSYDAFYELGYALLKMQEYERAIENYDRAMEIAEGTGLIPNILWQKAVCLIALGKNADACSLLKKSAEESTEEAVKLQKEYCN